MPTTTQDFDRFRPTNGDRRFKVKLPNGVESPPLNITATLIYVLRYIFDNEIITEELFSKFRNAEPHSRYYWSGRRLLSTMREIEAKSDNGQERFRTKKPFVYNNEQYYTHGQIGDHCIALFGWLNYDLRNKNIEIVPSNFELPKQLIRIEVDDFSRIEIPTDNHTENLNENSVHQERRMNMKEEIKQLVESNLQVILTGAPGTGKTYTARKVALEITGEAEDTSEDESRIKVVQFHPGYDYSDFVIGMKPILVSENGKEVFKDEQGRLYTTNNNEADGQRQDFSGKVRVSYVWRDGVFKDFANRAKEAYDTYPAGPQKFVFLIDEINRADLSRVFGELFSLFEEDYRYPTNRKGIILPNGEEFVIPKNLYIIGTMNDIDRSVESMDFALRRRFAWYEVSADKSERIIEDKIDDAETKRKLLNAMRQINEMIADPNTRLGKEYQLGGAIFAKYVKYQGEDDSFDSLWNNHIAVILNEYFRGRRDKESKLEALKNIYDGAVGMQPQNGVGGNETTAQA